MKDLGPEATSLLRDGDRFDPPAGARDRVKGALARRLGPAVAIGVVAATEAVAAGSGGAAGAGTTAWLAAPIAKIVGVVVLGGGIAGGAWGLARVVPSHHRIAAPIVAASHGAVDRRPPAAPNPVASAPPRPAGVEPAPVVTLPAPGRGDRRPARHAPPTVHGLSDPKASSAPPAPSLPRLGAEAALLRQVHTARTLGDAASALDLLQRYTQAFPGGAMADVARAEQVLTLCALGRDAEARLLARRFFQQEFTSPLTARINQSCAGEKP